MSTYTVRAKRWEHGWELHIDGVGVTQSRTLDGAERMVRDYIGSLTGRDASGDVVEIRPDLGGLEDKAAAVREWVERTQRESREAAAESRRVARELRAAGLSVSDAAAVLGVSRGRISQLGKAERLSGPEYQAGRQTWTEPGCLWPGDQIGDSPCMLGAHIEFGRLVVTEACNGEPAVSILIRTTSSASLDVAVREVHEGSFWQLSTPEHGGFPFWRL